MTWLPHSAQYLGVLSAFLHAHTVLARDKRSNAMRNHFDEMSFPADGHDTIFLSENHSCRREANDTDLSYKLRSSEAGTRPFRALARKNVPRHARVVSFASSVLRTGLALLLTPLPVLTWHNLAFVPSQPTSRLGYISMRQFRQWQLGNVRLIGGIPRETRSWARKDQLRGHNMKQPIAVHACRVHESGG